MKNEAVGAKELTIWLQLLITVIVQNASHASGEQNYLLRYLIPSHEPNFKPSLNAHSYF